MADEENPPNATVYVRNFNERVKIPLLEKTIREIFGEFGNIIDIVAKKNLKAKGQAFVVYESEEDAQDAIDTLQGFDLFNDGRKLVLAFAKSRSDATVLRVDGDEALEEHKKHRIAEKERKRALEAANATQAKRVAADSLAERPAKTTKPATQAPGMVPEELLPPNKILFIRELPENYGSEMLNALFSRYPGFKEIRMVPGRAGIAFVEYLDEESAVRVKEEMNGVALGDSKIKVTYQRQ